MKRCTHCGEEKPLDAFPPVRRGEPKLQSWCRACFAEANARNYAKDRERQKVRLVAQVSARRANVRAQLIAYLRAHPCVDCGESDIVVLEFDHVGEKSGDVSTIANGGRSWERVQQEIDRCEVRCANCHRRKSRQRERDLYQQVDDHAPEPFAHAQRGELGPTLLDALLEVRTCRVCGGTKPAADFPFRSKAEGTRQTVCKSCQRLYARAWYARNQQRQIANSRRNAKRSRRAMRRLVREYLRQHPCVDCGEADVEVLDFDHLRDKTAAISAMLSMGASWRTIHSEIEKCEVRCANCHRRKTVVAAGGYRLTG